MKMNFDGALEALKKTQALIAEVPAFKIRDDAKTELAVAKQLYIDGKESEAVGKLLYVDQGIRMGFASYIGKGTQRNCAEEIARMRQSGNFAADLMDRVEKALQRHEDAVDRAGRDLTHFESRLEAFKNLNAAIGSVKTEQRERNQRLDAMVKANVQPRGERERKRLEEFRAKKEARKQEAEASARQQRVSSAALLDELFA